MKKSDGNIKKRISGTSIPEEISQDMSEATTNSSKATSTTAGSSFSGIFRRLVCSSSKSLPDDTTERVFIPAQPK